MRVWIVNPFDNLPSEGNRAQRYWLMSEAFARAGWRVVYWTSDFSHATKRARKAVQRAGEAVGRGKCEVGGGIEVVQIPTLPYGKNICLARIRSHRKLAADFERLAMDRMGQGERVELVVASTPPLGLCAAAMRVAAAAGAKFVCDIQDAWPETFSRLLPRGVKWAAGMVFAPMYRTARSLYRGADLVTGVCARYRELSGRSDFYLAYHGIAGAGRARTASGGKRRLVYVGNLGEGYDLKTVIEAVSRREGMTLDIAGMGPTESALRVRVEELGLDKRVRFHGYLGEAALGELMARCEVGVIPMRDDSWVGLPYKLGDYLKAGLMVVSSLHGECGEWLERTRFGQVYEGGSVESLLKALDALDAAVAVAVPAELRSEGIYDGYEQRCREMLRSAGVVDSGDVK